ncbi:MAG: efflux transporter outer membrane subunit, partial [Rhizobiales bacterium]|nr:efflux transporter outer membrane subunit [Rhizobacter sp.]
MKRLRIASLGCAVLAAGCNSLAPPYERAALPVPAGWPVGDAYLKASEATLPRLDADAVFRDPKLQQLISLALARNRDLAAAVADVASARALVTVARAAFYPRVDAGASASAVRTVGSSEVDGRYAVDIGVSAFELDLFGRIRSLSDAAVAEYLGTEAGARTVRLTLVAEVARVYLTRAADLSLLQIARATEANAERSVALTRSRLEGGVAPRSDLRQAETILYAARADVAQLTTAVAQDLNALELLVGQRVDAALLPESIENVEGLLGEVPAGLDSSILLRRPDVVQAEYTLRAANARIGAARAAFFPTLSLTGAAGFASSTLSSLFTGGAFQFSAGPALQLPIFDGGANRGNLAFSQADRDAALARYERTIQTAFREVADGLARRGTIGAEVA